MAGFLEMSKQKTPLKRIPERGGCVGVTRMGKYVWGRILRYLHRFGVNFQFRVSYFELQTRLGICRLTHPIGLCHPHHRDLHTLARSRQACSVTHRKDYKPFQSEWSKSTPEYSVIDLFAPN